MNNSVKNTATHALIATVKRSPPISDMTIPVPRATTPAHTEEVAFIIAGNVITDNVTYGT